MGFLQAVYSLGKMVHQRNQNSPLADIINFLQLPYPLTESEDGATYVIRVWLEVVDHNSDLLDIKGVSYVDRIEYQAIGTEEIKIRERCLYRNPVGNNVSWRFSPLYKLGKGSKDPHKELLGKSGEWLTDKNSRFYKLYQTVLKDYENSGFFTKGSSGRIMTGLIKQVAKIIEYWSDRKNPYFLLFGIKIEDKFLYPGEIPAFVQYFRKKLNPEDSTILNKSKNRENNIIVTYCALCGEKGKRIVTLDKVFKFSTFDKPGFLPGIKDGSGIREKVFPICENCYATLSAGKEEMENRFVDSNTIPGVNLYVIPEIIFDNQEYYRRVADFTKEFLTKGIRHESNLFRSLARHGEGLVYHFLFAEINQAQLIVHSLIEDVPPTHLKQLENLWEKTCKAFGNDSEPDNVKLSLDAAFRQIVAILLSLAGKREQDKVVMREKAIGIISALLNGEPVKTYEVKAIIVSRLAGLFTDPDWIKPKEKRKMPGRLRMKGMAEVVDYLYRVNKEGNYESQLVGRVL